MERKRSHLLPTTRYLTVEHHTDQADSLAPEFRLQNPGGRRGESALLSSSMTFKGAVPYRHTVSAFLNTESFQPHSGDSHLEMEHLVAEAGQP